MNLAVRIVLIALLFSLSPAIRAQGNQELVEEIKRMAGELADLREANNAQTKRISQMQKEIDSLRDAARDSREHTLSKMGDFATRDDLKKIVESIRDVDKKREDDRKVILAEFEKLGKTLAPAPSEKSEPKPRKSHEKRDSEPEKEPAVVEGTFLPVKVKDGQRLADIQKEYNAALKEKGLPPVTLDQIKRANPKMNPNKIFVGQEILLPVPDKKK